MQPYQKESEKSRRSGENVLNALKYTAGTAIGGGVASVGSKYSQEILGKIGAFLSPYLSEDLAIKGLTKVNKRVGDFAKKAVANGADFDEVREFIGEKITGNDGKKREEGKEKRNIIEQYDPELHAYIQEKVKSGESPIAAGEKAKGHRRFDQAIKKITKDHKRPWADILQEIYGIASQQSQQQQPQQAQQPSQQQPQAQLQHKDLPIQQRMGSQPQQGQPAPQGQPGQGQQALMAILQKIQQARGGAK